jgi:predicted metalloprotease
VGVGPRNGDLINAQLVPFRIEDVGEVNAEDLEGRPNRLDVRLAKGAAKIVASDGERFCGLGSDLTGVYRKVR